MDNSDLLFRKAEEADIARIWEIIGQAKAQMRRLNSHQWDENYPALENIAKDIQSGNGYVFCNKENIAVTYGVISFDGEPAYKEIDGKWINDLPYMVVHRLAVADEMKHQGLAKRFMLQAEEVSRNKGIYAFRIDTNFDNQYMLRLIDSLGFSYSGEVSYRGDKRKAFEKSIRPHSSSFGIPGYTIREAIYEDAEIIYEAIDKHREDLRIWLPFVDGLNSVADEQSFLESTLKVPYKERDVVYIIEKGFAICGLIGFHFSDRANHRTEIGYWLLPEFRGKGVITRAVHYLCQWAFFEKDFNRIQVRCAVGNQPSNAIPQRLGFTLEGTERDGELLSSGEYTDINVYSLLRKELELK